MRSIIRPTLEPLQASCIHLCLDSQSELTPNAIALKFQDQTLTYRELNLKANQLANFLKGKGVGPEVKVGICAERSLEIVIAILGVLKAGGVYVPLDPSYPQDRLSFILEETQVPLLLTQSHLIDKVPRHSAKIVCLDQDQSMIAVESEDSPLLSVTDQNLAYIMYTSGSTGRPKGVQITHANIWHYIWAVGKVLEVTARDVYLHTASFSFSSSVRQLMVPLSKGATSVIASREQTKNPLSLFKLIQQQGVTLTDTVPSVWHYGLQALETLDPEQAEALLEFNLRAVAFTGELTPCQLLQKLRHKLKHKPRFFNIYGQTETVGSCAYAIPEQFDRENGYVPVGYAYPHNQVYILDDELRPVVDGEVGELHLGGTCLAQGYLNRPELNQEKYIELEVEERPVRLFKTGDLVRRLPDGVIELLGRIDFQVKIRGMRVE